MKLFRQILGKPSVKETPVESFEQRLSKLTSKPEAEIIGIIRDASAPAEDLDLRLALITKLSYGPQLLALASNDGAAPAIEKAARQQIAQLHRDEKVTVDTLLADIKDVECRLAIAAFARSESFEVRTLNDVSDQVSLANLCEAATSAKVRQLLAERIEAPDQLRRLAKLIKHKDKNAYKTLKAKLDILRAQELKDEAIKAEVGDIIKELAQHENRPLDREYPLRFERLQTRWQAVEESASDEEKMHYQNAHFGCENKITQAKVEREAEASRIQQVSQAQDQRHSVLDKLWALVSEILSLPSADAQALAKLEETASELEAEWGALKQLKKPTREEEKDHTLLLDALGSLLGGLNKGGDTLPAILARIERAAEEPAADASEASSQDSAEEPTDNTDKEFKLLKRLIYPVQGLSQYQAPEVLVKARDLIRAQRVDQQKQKDEHEKQLRIVGGLIRKVNRAIDDGHLKQAIGIRHSINEKIEHLDAVPTHLSRQLETLDEAVRKLVDWQAYAVVPKKKALIEAMEKLVDCDIPPEALATKIKKLQEQWRSLSQSGEDRGEDLWQQFSALADKAYEPCKVYYQELSELRKENLVKRQTLVNQLNDFYVKYDWEQADWKHVETIMRTARSELHTYAPVERSANKPVLEAFDEVIEKLHSKVNEEFDRNKASKTQLIVQAEKATEIADIQQATETVKRLQAQWKKIGRCQYRDNEALWKQFRTHCDKVFERKDQKMNEARAETDAKIAAARVFVDKVKALAEKSGEGLLSARSERDELQRDFAEVAAGEDLPEKVQKAIVRDFHKAVENLDRKVEQVLRDQQQVAWKNFFDACEKINAQHAGESAESDLDAHIAEVSVWPEGCAALIKEKLTASPSEQDPQARIKALKLLCIRAEILADNDTPAEDKALRMEYQVKMLQQGLGGQRLEDGSRVLAKAWAKADAVPQLDYQRLYERFYASWTAIK